MTVESSTATQTLFEPAQPIRVIGSTIATGITESDAIPATPARQWNGFDGKVYAIPSRNSKLENLDLEAIETYVKEFLAFAKSHSDKIFEVTQFASYDPKVLAPLFKSASRNCVLPGIWQRISKPELPRRVLLNDPDHRLGEKKIQVSLRQFLRDFGGAGKPAVELVIIEGYATQKLESLIAELSGVPAFVVRAPCSAKPYERVLATEQRAVWYATDLLTIPVRDDSLTLPFGMRLLSLASRARLNLLEIMNES